VAVLSGCTGDAGSGERGGDAEASAGRGSLAPSGVSASEAPDSRSGDLGQEDLPPPADLGSGWEYRVDKGSAEDGYLGSGEPAIARDPASVLAAITPLGCRPGRLPMPEAALEVTYAREALPGVGLLLQFADEDSARRFFTEHARVLSTCSADGGANVAIKTRTENLLVTTRRDEVGGTPPWAEGVALRGDEVMLIAVADASVAGIRSVTSALT
jgi:hypothetical protein